MEGEDLISRQVVKELMLKYGFTAPDMTVTEFAEDILPPVAKEFEYHYDHTESGKKVIEHLEQMPSAQPKKRMEERMETHACDLIDREAAIDAVKKNTFRLTFAEEQNCEGHVAWSAEAVYSDVMEGALLELPSAQPEIDKDINVPVNDCISRQWLMECVNEGWIKFDTEKDENRFIHLVRDIAPSAQPERIRGRWIDKDGGLATCSVCGDRWGVWSVMHFCPNCGADMREE